MIDINSLVPGLKVWYGRLEFSYRGVRVTKQNFPKQYTIKNIETVGDYRLRDKVTIVDSEGKEYCIYNFLLHYGTDINYSFYETEKDAYEEGWKPCVLDELDKLENYYQKMKKYLEGKLPENLKKKKHVKNV